MDSATRPADAPATTGNTATPALAVAHTATHTAAHSEISGCGLCALRSRRLFTGLLLTGGAAALAGSPWTPASAQQDAGDAGVRGDVGRNSRFTKLVSAEQIEASAAQQYLQLTREASGQRVLVGADHPQVLRLRSIASRIVPFTPPWNDRARRWKWEVNLLGNRELNAFCMPGGKIAFYMGILQKLQLSDDEVATIMGHEMAHALREHARERIGKSLATRGALEVGAAIFGLGDLGRLGASVGSQLLSLKFGREDETEADLVGLDLAARAGYDPNAGVSLWQKMAAASKGSAPKWLSTHPSGDTRIKDIQSKLPKVLPLFAKAPKPSQRFAPPPLG
jgi:predicted Zn-dependent protease